LTRISSAQASPSPLLDQIGSQAGAAKDNGDTAAFDSHLARFSQDANGEPAAKDANSVSSSPASNDQPALGKDQSNSVSALFAALTGDARAKEGPADFNSQLARSSTSTSAQQPAENLNVASSALETGAQSGGGAPSAVSTLFATLTGNTQSNEAETSALAAKQTAEEAAAKSGTGSNPGMGHKGQVGASVPRTSISFANDTAADTALTQMQGKTPGGAMPKDNVQSPVQAKPASRSSDAAAAADMTQPADMSLDPASAAAAMMAMPMAQPLSAQNAVAAQTPGKLAGAAGSGSNVLQSPAASANGSQALGARSLTSPASDVQSQQDSLPSVTQKDAFSLSTDSSEGDGASSQTIKMKISSIEAQTHFAPVQQLSPTVQITDFIASAAGTAAAPLTSADSPGSAAAAASSQSPDTGAVATSQPSTSMIKTLTLSLEPDSLGTVTVTMRLADSGLDLQLEAAKSETTSLIEKDKGSLSDRLQTLGYSVDSLVVKTAAMQGTQQDPSNGQSTMGQGQQQAGNDASASGLSQNGGRNGNDQSPTQRGRETAAGLNRESGSDSSGTRTVGDGVYV
jgi:trimeric autotransporter adhesin